MLGGAAGSARSRPPSDLQQGVTRFPLYSLFPQGSNRPTIHKVTESLFSTSLSTFGVPTPPPNSPYSPLQLELLNCSQRVLLTDKDSRESKMEEAKLGKCIPDSLCCPADQRQILEGIGMMQPLTIKTEQAKRSCNTCLTNSPKKVVHTDGGCSRTNPVTWLGVAGQNVQVQVKREPQHVHVSELVAVKLEQASPGNKPDHPPGIPASLNNGSIPVGIAVARQRVGDAGLLAALSQKDQQRMHDLGIENFVHVPLTVEEFPSWKPTLVAAARLWCNLKQATTLTTTSVPSCSQNTESSYNELESDLDDNIILEMLTCRPPFPDFDLKTLLTTSPTGNSIIKFYETNKYLTNKHRNNLTDIISRRIFTRVVNHRINHEEYNIITSKIIALFPTENAGIYFVPPVKKRHSISGKPGFAKGKLVDKIRNTLFKSGEHKRKLSDKENVDCIKSKKTKNIEELQDLHKDDVVWLKNNSEPWEDVINKWKSTYELRQLLECANVGSFIEYWPILNDARSDVLIHLDFDAIYPGRANKLHLLWNKFIGKIKDIKKPHLKGDNADLVEYIDGLADEDHKFPTQIKLLCHLVPPKGRLNKRQKFSTTECIESLIVNVKTPGDIQKRIDEISTNAYEKRSTVQPYIIHCTDEDIGGTFYLIADKIRYVFKSAYKAFDTLFKIYHTLHVSYPKSGYHLYLLIQKCVYDINTRYDETPPYILDLISYAKC